MFIVYGRAICKALLRACKRNFLTVHGGEDHDTYDQIVTV